MIIGLSQGEKTIQISYTTQTLTEVLSNFGGEVFAVVGIFGILLSRYQSFKYEMEALSSLYFYKSESNATILIDQDNNDRQTQKEIFKDEIRNLSLRKQI